MQHGLEVRCPLLDRRVVELAFQIPAHRKFSLDTSKVLLRRLAHRRLPAPLLSMPKHGFTAPIGRWIADTHAQQFRDDVFGAASAASGLMDVGEVRRMFDEHTAGARDHSYALWAIWMLERWHTLHSRSQSATAPAPALVHA